MSNTDSHQESLRINSAHVYQTNHQAQQAGGKKVGTANAMNDADLLKAGSSLLKAGAVMEITQANISASLAPPGVKWSPASLVGNGVSSFGEKLQFSFNKGQGQGAAPAA